MPVLTECSLQGPCCKDRDASHGADHTRCKSPGSVRSRQKHEGGIVHVAQGAHALGQRLELLGLSLLHSVEMRAHYHDGDLIRRKSFILCSGVCFRAGGSYAANQNPLLFRIGMVGEFAGSLFPRFFKSTAPLFTCSCARFNLNRRNLFLDTL